jgi:PBP1b-binding outer membrane lipoprotein LpoB
MKTYIIAILVALLLIVGCNKEVVPEAEPVVEEVPEAEPVVEPVEETVVAENAPASSSEGLSYETVDERAQRLIDACKAGNAGLCAALKSQYGIEMSPLDTQEEQEDMSEEMAENSELGE